MDLLYKYGAYRSQPTAFDISKDGRYAVVLTYKHAYLFFRKQNKAWESAMGKKPQTILLPLPEKEPGLQQREAISFIEDGLSLLVTSEGINAALFQINGLE